MPAPLVAETPQGQESEQDPGDEPSVQVTDDAPTSGGTQRRTVVSAGEKDDTEKDDETDDKVRDSLRATPGGFADPGDAPKADDKPAETPSAQGGTPEGADSAGAGNGGGSEAGAAA